MRGRGTETALWASLAGALRSRLVPDGKRLRFTRIECTTMLGVSDVEYIATPYNGWIELKVADYRGENNPLRLHEPLKATQLEWLITHSDYPHNLSSYLLVGVLGATTWRELLLLPAGQAATLLHNRLAPSVAVLRTLTGVISAPGPKGIIDYFAGHAM